MRRRKDDWGFFELIVVIITVGIIGLFIWVLITYGGKPISELPAWVVPFFLSHRRA